MKQTFLLFCVASLLCLASCTPDRNVLNPLSIYGYSFSGGMTLTDAHLDGGNFVVRALPGEYINTSMIGDLNLHDALWNSVHSGKLSERASAEEAFAFERITERNQKLLTKLKEYRARLIEKGLTEKNLGAALVNTYVQGKPSIVADDVLFGQPAGTDLSDWFVFRDYNIVEVDGMDYKMIERAGIRDQYQTPAEFFTTDRMLPFSIRVSTVGLPEEATFDELPRMGGDNVILVTISIPVQFERYWDWCKELYSNPDAQEQIVSGTVRIKIPFERKP